MLTSGKWVPLSQVPDITGMTIRLKADAVKPELRDDFNLICKATGGFGCHAEKSGRAVFVDHQDGEHARWERYMVEAVFIPTPEGEEISHESNN